MLDAGEVGPAGHKRMRHLEPASRAHRHPSPARCRTRSRPIRVRTMPSSRGPRAASAERHCVGSVGARPRRRRPGGDGRAARAGLARGRGGRRRRAWPGRPRTVARAGRQGPRQPDRLRSTRAGRRRGPPPARTRPRVRAWWLPASAWRNRRGASSRRQHDDEPILASGDCHRAGVAGSHPDRGVDRPGVSAAERHERRPPPRQAPLSSAPGPGSAYSSTRSPARRSAGYVPSASNAPNTASVGSSRLASPTWSGASSEPAASGTAAVRPTTRAIVRFDDGEFAIDGDHHLAEIIVLDRLASGDGFGERQHRSSFPGVGVKHARQRARCRVPAARRRASASGSRGGPGRGAAAL